VVDGPDATTRTLADVVSRAEAGYDDLLALAETIEDEWSETNDLAAAWRSRLEDVAAARGAEPAAPRILEALDVLLDEAASIDDAHRAIDWLSTFPQVLLTALGERP
jgi:hypothetical protein